MANILLLEHEPVLAVLIRSALDADGHRVSEPSHPFDGDFDLVLAEVSQGLLLGKLLSGQTSDVKIVFMTDYTSVGGAIFSLRNGATVLEKPFTAQKLRRTVRETLVREAKPSALRQRPFQPFDTSASRVILT
jgi:DNA-binding response OmpR family regulator